MRRGDIYAAAGQLFVLVTPTAMLEVLPTAWGLLVTEVDPGTPPPLAIHAPGCLIPVATERPDDHGADDERVDAWVRMTQIRTVATTGLDQTLRGHIAGEAMASIDRVLPRLAGVD